MRALFVFFILALGKPGAAAIYDCFIFFNELELLEVRFHELYDVVDKFVLVESPQTFKGFSKPLYFAENKERFAKFLDKVIHVVVELPMSYNDQERTEHCNYVRENRQRDLIMLGLTDCVDDDIIFISDVDEIWRGNLAGFVSEKLLNKECDKVRLNMLMYRYFLDRLDSFTPYWNGAGALTFGHLKTMSPTEFRGVITGWSADWSKHKWPLLCGNAGWHFTYMGGHEKVKDKIRAFAHVEGAHPHFRTDPKEIDKNVLEWTCQVQIDKSYPLFIQQNNDYFRELGFIYD